MTPLHLACKLGHEAVVATLLNENPKKGGSLDSHPPDLNARTSAGVMPLALAALEGHLGIAERLIKAGAAVDGAGTAKETALHRAVKAGHLPVVEALLKAGAGVNRLDMRRRSPLDLVPKGAGGHALRLVLASAGGMPGATVPRDAGGTSSAPRGGREPPQIDVDPKDLFEDTEGLFDDQPPLVPVRHDL